MLPLDGPDGYIYLVRPDGTGRHRLTRGLRRGLEPGALELRERRQHAVSVALELRRPDARHGCELVEASRPAGGDLLQGRVVEDEIGRDLVFARAGEPPGLQRVEAGRR